MKDTLYSISNDYKEVLEHLEYYTDELGKDEDLQAAYDTLDAIDENLKDKAEKLGDIVKNKLAEADALKAEAKRLTERAAKAAKDASKLMDYVKHTMDNAGFTELKGLKHTFKIGESISLQCSDAQLVPKHFQKVKVEADIAGFKKHIQEKYEEKGIKLVSKPSAKPKGPEMLFTDLDLSEMGLQFIKNRKLNLK